MLLRKAADDGELICIAVTGDVSQALLVPGEDPLAQVAGENCYARRVFVDLSAVAWIDSSGVGWLIACQKRFRAAGGVLVVHSPPEFAREMLSTLRLHLVLRLAADEAEARHLIANHQE